MQLIASWGTSDIRRGEKRIESLAERLTRDVAGQYRMASPRDKKVVPEDDDKVITGLLPSSRDILLGRGKRYELHEGNVRLQGIVEGLMPNFICARRGGKKLVVEQVLDQVSEEECRFLKQSRRGTENWEEVEHEVAFEKVAQVS